MALEYVGQYTVSVLFLFWYHDLKTDKVNYTKVNIVRKRISFFGLLLAKISTFENSKETCLLTKNMF